MLTKPTDTLWLFRFDSLSNDDLLRLLKDIETQSSTSSPVLADTAKQQFQSPLGPAQPATAMSPPEQAKPSAIDSVVHRLQSLSPFKQVKSQDSGRLTAWRGWLQALTAGHAGALCLLDIIVAMFIGL